MASRPAALKLIKVLEDINDEVKAIIKNSGYTPSCGNHCAGCCRTLVVITFLEALALVDHVDYAMEQTLLEYDPVDRETHFARGIPCVFLRDESCSVYESRPGACRFAYVVNDPSDCAPGKVQQLIDTEEARHAGIKESSRIAAEHGIADKFGPMPIMLRAALAFVRHGASSANGILQEYSNRVKRNKTRS